MDIRIESLVDGAARAAGTVVVIDVFRAFTCAAVALARGARRIVMVDDLEQARTLKAAGVGTLCMGERRGRRPDGFDFPNSPALLDAAELDGRVLIQTTSNGTAGLWAAAGNAERLYAAGLVNAAATARAVLRAAPSVVTLVAMGQYGRDRADEDELCAFYLRALLRGRSPDAAALERFLGSLLAPPPVELVANGHYHPRDRTIAMATDRYDLAIRVRREDGLLIAEPEYPDAPG